MVSGLAWCLVSGLACQAHLIRVTSSGHLIRATSEPGENLLLDFRQGRGKNIDGSVTAWNPDDDPGCAGQNIRPDICQGQLVDAAGTCRPSGDFHGTIEPSGSCAQLATSMGELLRAQG